MDITAGIAPTRLVDVGRNLSTVMSGANPADLPIQIQTTITNTVSYTFSLFYDNHLVAVWTDGAAVDYDPGITTTITIPQFAGQTVTSIDILHGFEQSIIASQENGNLVLCDLLVKDYPIILRLSTTKDVLLPILVRYCEGRQAINHRARLPCCWYNNCTEFTEGHPVSGVVVRRGEI